VKNRIACTRAQSGCYVHPSGALARPKCYSKSSHSAAFPTSPHSRLSLCKCNISGSCFAAPSHHRPILPLYSRWSVYFSLPYPVLTPFDSGDPDTGWYRGLKKTRTSLIGNEFAASFLSLFWRV